MIRIMLAAGAALLAAGCASTDQTASTAAAAPGGRDCFNARSVNGFGVIDARTVRVDVGANRAYALTLMSDARELNYNERLGIESDQNWICTGNGLGVQVHSIDRNFPRSWPVTAIARLPDEQASAGS